MPGLAPDETVFVVSGLVPNRKSHPLVYEWVGITFRDENFVSLTTFDEWWATADECSIYIVDIYRLL